MRKVLLGLLYIFCGILFTACSHDMNRKEIDEISFILVMGIDYSNGEYTVTTVYGLGQSEGSDQEEKEEVTTGKGKTPYEAFQEVRLKNKRSISVANIGYILIGEGAAKKGLGQSLDYFSREQSIKMESLLYVTQGMDASKFIKDAMENGQTVSDDLETMEQKQSDLVTRNDNSLVNVLNESLQHNSSVLLPYLISSENTFIIQGYAVFDELKLIDYLDMDTSSGINFVKDIVREFPIYLEDRVGLELSYSKTKIKTELEDSIVKVKISIEFETMIKEVYSDENVFQPRVLEELTQLQDDYIKSIVKRAIDYSIDHGVDIMQMARLVENQHFNRWSDLEKHWHDMIPLIEYEIETNSKISKSFILG